MIIVILVSVFFTTLSNLNELGTAGWLLTGASGYALYRIYRGIHENFRLTKRRNVSKLSGTLESFMFYDATAGDAESLRDARGNAAEWDKQSL